MAAKKASKPTMAQAFKSAQKSVPARKQPDPGDKKPEPDLQKRNPKDASGNSYFGSTTPPPKRKPAEPEPNWNVPPGTPWKKDSPFNPKNLPEKDPGKKSPKPQPPKQAPKPDNKPVPQPEPKPRINQPDQKKKKTTPSTTVPGVSKASAKKKSK